MAAFVPAIMSAAGNELPDDPMLTAQAEIAARYMPFNVANSVILVALGVVLLIGGIKLLRRRRSGVGMTRLWAIGRIVWSLPAAYVTYVMTNETVRLMQQAAADSGQPMPGGFTTLLQAMGPIGAALSLCMWCVVPVFVLIWFARAKIKNEVAAWS
jgi:hypothetical protein